MKRVGRAILVGLAVLAAAGCTPVLKQRGQSPLRTPRMSPDSVVLDIFCVRIDPADAATCEALWHELDEQHFPAECRRRLWENGLRAGVLAGRVPPALVELLELEGKPVGTNYLQQALALDPGRKPKVTRRHLQLRPGTRAEVPTCAAREEIPLFVVDDAGRLSGQTYKQAQPLLALNVVLAPESSVRLTLVPEIQHGLVQRQYVSDQPGVLRIDAGQKREAFDALRIEALLAPGDMIVVSSVPARLGSLGQHFFAETQPGEGQQKLLVVRLSQTQHEEPGDVEAPMMKE